MYPKRRASAALPLPLPGQHVRPAGTLQAATLQQQSKHHVSRSCMVRLSLLSSCRHAWNSGRSYHHSESAWPSPPSGGWRRQASSADRSGSAVPNGRLSSSVDVQPRWTIAATVFSAAARTEGSAPCSACCLAAACLAWAYCPSCASFDCTSSAVVPVDNPCASRL